jgi:hypothetical protein
MSHSTAESESASGARPASGGYRSRSGPQAAPRSAKNA